MANQTITELTGEDVDFDQTVESDEVVALAGGAAVNGDVDDSVINTGVNTGIMAGDDVDLDHSVVGDGNTQISDSTVGAFAARGDATNIEGENLNLGRGDLLDVDTDGGDAQVVNGNGNQTFGDIDVDADGAAGPVNAVFGDGNRANAIQDNSTNVEDSFNTDNSVEDSGNVSVDDSFNSHFEDNDSESVSVDDSFNDVSEDNDVTSLDFEQSFEDNSVVEDNDTFEADLDVTDIDVDFDDFDLDLA